MNAKSSSQNARIIHKYLTYCSEALGRLENTVDIIAAAIADFDRCNQYKDFKRFKPDWAIEYKKELGNRRSLRSKHTLASATVKSRLDCISRFIIWLSDQDGYRSRIRPSDALYFSLTSRNSRIGQSTTRKSPPSIANVIHVLASMPIETELEREARAVIAFILLSGGRADAAASMRLGYVDIAKRTVSFDGRTMRTKGAKSYTAFFFPVGEIVEAIVVDWINELTDSKRFGPHDPLFPAAEIARDANHLFAKTGTIGTNFWESSAPIRTIFGRACLAAGVPYFSPHSLRSTLGLLGQRFCKTIEDSKSWSLNMGHSDIATTFQYYGRLDEATQINGMRRLSQLIDTSCNIRPPKTSKSASPRELRPRPRSIAALPLFTRIWRPCR